MTLTRRMATVAAVSAVALSLAACGTSQESAGENGNSSLQGEISGAGASSQGKAQEAWFDTFMVQNDDVTITYNPVGSGGGREQFIAGAVDFAGSDSPLKEGELAGAKARCLGGEALELPVYISPIAIFYNVPGFEGDKHINMTPDVMADVFNGTITKWNDARLAALNPGGTLPDLAIVPVSRSDESGTTKNFQAYLNKVAPAQWPHKAEETWPIQGGQSGDGTSGMVSTVAAAPGAIGYADASRVTADLGTVAVGTDGNFTPFSAQAAAATVDASELADDATDLRLVYKIKRDAPDTYPIVLVSYVIACSKYEDPAVADTVAAYLRFIASEEGQEISADPKVAGSAPISADLRVKVEAAIAQITSE
ncbi:MAG: phosphate ABC transporter substrate-binding protein PstS [Buchananella hordeovulneris]|nr:phosphate ABC transporter substrate-binding protein PstS [Buchananella hordeovulneris]